MQLAPGELFQHRYRVLHLLGRGGFAAVFAAEDQDLGRRVAIKVLLPGRGDRSEARFLREARVLATLRDPHTIRLYDFGATDDGTYFMVFEYLADAQDLKQLTATLGPQPPEVVLGVLRQLLSALQEAHAAGVLHRDIKPANILAYRPADERWRVKLIDFGIAKPTLSRGGDAVTQLTQEGTLLGTPRYMPPEAFLGEEPTPASDLYSVGLVAYELLAGRPAIGGERTEDVVRSALSSEPFTVPVTGTALDRVLPWLLQRDPAARPQSAAQVQAELKRTPSAARVRERVTTRRTLLAPVAGAVALVLLVVALVATTRRAQPPLPQPPLKTDVRVNPFGEALADPPQRHDVGDRGGRDASTPDAEVAVDGCGREIAPGLREHSGAMRWFTYVPTSYDPTHRHRVVLLLHNALRNGRDAIEGTNFIELAEQHRLILVAPSSPRRTAWDRPEDLELVQQLLESVREGLCVDERYLYGLGHGGGGDFLREARCTIPFSAIAISASGEYDGAKTCETTPMPMLRIYGRDDRHVPANGGLGCYGMGKFKPARVIEREWKELNQTPNGPTTWRRERTGRCTRWDGETGGVTVVCRVDGGHDWHGLQPPIELPGCAAPPMEFPLRDTVWQFFEQYGVALPGAEDAVAPVDDHPLERVDPSR